jgi:hypothetical protein
MLLAAPGVAVVAFPLLVVLLLGVGGVPLLLLLLLLLVVLARRSAVGTSMNPGGATRGR